MDRNGPLLALLPVYFYFRVKSTEEFTSASNPPPLISALFNSNEIPYR